MMRTMAQKMWVWKETEQAKCPGHYSYVPGCSNPRDHLHLAQASLEEIGLRLQILLVTPHSIVNAIAMTYVSVLKATNMSFQQP